MARSITPEQSIVIPSASTTRQLAHVPGAPRLTRRHVAGWAAMAGTAGLLLPARVLAGTEYQGEVPKDAGDDPANSTEYTGPLHGHVVTWDPDVWLYSSSASPDLNYDYDYINLSSLETGGLAQVQHQEVAFDDIDQAAEEGFDQYLGIYAMDRGDAELMEEWVSDDAAGTLFYWLGYDDLPYTYIEFAATDDQDVWSLTYVQIRASSWDAGDMANMLESIWTDDELTIHATDIDDIVDAIDADAN